MNINVLMNWLLPTDEIIQDFDLPSVVTMPYISSCYMLAFIHVS